MKRYKYIGVLDNKVTKGIIEEENIYEAVTFLKSKNIKIIDIKEDRKLFDFLNRKSYFKSYELSSICGQLAIIINAGVSLIKGLEIIFQQSRNKKIKQAVNSILASVKKGISLGKAMESTGYFPKLMTDMIISGELTGDIDTVLYNLEAYYEREHTIKSKIKTASIYPMVIFITVLVMLTFFDLFIFKSLKDLFSLNPDLPLISKMLMRTFDYINENFLRFLLEIFVFFLIFFVVISNKKVKYYFDYLTLKMPLIGEFKKDIITLGFINSLYVFIRAGLPMIKIVESFDMIVINKYYAKKLSDTKQEIITGGRLSDALLKMNLFEPIVIQMINVGEETGELEESLAKLIKVYEKKIDNGLTRLMSLVEPMFTLIIGIVVGIIIIAVALPVLQMSNSIK